MLNKDLENLKEIEEIIKKVIRSKYLPEKLLDKFAELTDTESSYILQTYFLDWREELQKREHYMAKSRASADNPYQRKPLKIRYFLELSKLLPRSGFRPQLPAPQPQSPPLRRPSGYSPYQSDPSSQHGPVQKTNLRTVHRNAYVRAYL